MKIKSGYVVRMVAGQYLALPVGARSRELHGVIAMNGISAFLWEQMQTDKTQQELAEVLMKKFEKDNVDEAKALAAVAKFVELLKREDMLEDA